jgi:hypothetical protein
MVRLRQRLALLLPVAGLAGLTFIAPPSASSSVDSAAKGAQIFCFMRSNGNDHKVSWEAAYALIKRQKSGMFKTSPEHAAVMITEAVVKEPGSYPDCGKYLGDLFGSSKGSNGLQSTIDSTINPAAPSSSSNSSSSSNTTSSDWSEDDRYSY